MPRRGQLLIPESGEAFPKGRFGGFPFIFHKGETGPVTEKIHPAGIILLGGGACQVEVQVNILHELEEPLAEEAARTLLSLAKEADRPLYSFQSSGEITTMGRENDALHPL